MSAATANTSSEEIRSTTSPSTGQKSQVTQNSPRRNSVGEEGIDLIQRPLSTTPPKPPTSGFSTIGTEQTFATPAIPIATAVEFSPVNLPIAEPFNQLKISEETALFLAKKEKGTAFETEFSEMIESAKTQAEEVAAVATTAREKAEKIGTSEKMWSEALEEAIIAE